MPIAFNALGNTGISVSRIGLGLAALGRPGYINLGHAEDFEQGRDEASMEKKAHEMLDLALQSGITYFDAARSYGLAEQFLGNWLGKRANISGPDQIIVGSKWGYTYTADWQVEAEKHEVKDHSLEVLLRQWKESSVLLPHLRLYQIHSATFESGVLDNKDVLNELAQLKEGGLKIGLSLSGPQQSVVLEKALEIYIDGFRLFDTVQATFNLLELSAGKTLEAASDEGIGIIIKETLANGRLTSRNQAPSFVSRRTLLEEISRDLHVGIDALAMAFVLAQPWVHIALSGAARSEHLLSNIQGADVFIPPSVMDRLSQIAEYPDEYWKKRSALEWN